MDFCVGHMYKPGFAEVIPNGTENNGNINIIILGCLVYIYFFGVVSSS